MEMLMQNNGFTLLETLFVLMLVSFSSFLYLKRPSYNLLNVEVHKLAIQCLQMQELAFSEKREIRISFKENEVEMDGKSYVYPKMMSCSSKSFHYNEKGNISNALTVHCQKGTQKRKLIFQLGQGRIHEE